MRVVGEREREIIRPGETLQPGRSAIKTRIRDEASGVCFWAGGSALGHISGSLLKSLLFLLPGCTSSTSPSETMGFYREQGGPNCGCWERIWVWERREEGMMNLSRSEGSVWGNSGAAFCLLSFHPSALLHTFQFCLLLSIVSVLELLGSLIEWILHDFSYRYLPASQPAAAAAAAAASRLDYQCRDTEFSQTSANLF